MPKKTIVLEKVTVHVSKETFLPFKFDSNGFPLEGKYDVEAIPPKTPVTLDAKEADRLLSLFEGHEVGTIEPEDTAAVKRGSAKA